MEYYKAEGDSGHTVYLDTGHEVWCEIYHPSGNVSEVSKLDDSWPIERVIGQLGAEPAPNETLSHREMCISQPNVASVCAPIECPECGTYGYHAGKRCESCGYADCWCASGDWE